MKSPGSMGMNRTGTDLSRPATEALLEGVREAPPSSEGDLKTLAYYRTSYLRDADPIGTVPIPGTFKGTTKASMHKSEEQHIEVLIDKLGGRLAFERTGTRLYEALIGKCLVRKDEMDRLSLEQLQQFRDEEAAHLRLIWDALQQLGADPTCVTPMADINGVASIGLMQILSDPRTSVAQSLHAIHMAELTDNDGWRLLIKLATELGQNEMAQNFQQALAEEDEHLTVVRRLSEQTCLSQAGIS